MDYNLHEPRKYIQLEDDRPPERGHGLRWWPRLSSSVWWSLIGALVLAVAVVGWTMSRQRRQPVRQGNFLDAASLDFVEDLGYLYFDPTDSRVYVFTSFCDDDDKNNNHAENMVETSCGSYYTDCPNDEGYSFCVCGEAWKVTWAGDYELLSKQTPRCIESVSLDEGKQGSVILADLANRVVESLTVDFSNVDPKSATFAADVAEAIVNSEDYQKRWEG
jgi:hypothetical protein